MAKWLEQASQWHEMNCHYLEVMSLNPNRVEPGVHCTSVLSRMEPNINSMQKLLTVYCNMALELNIYNTDYRLILLSTNTSTAVFIIINFSSA